MDKVGGGECLAASPEEGDGQAVKVIGNEALAGSWTRDCGEGTLPAQNGVVRVDLELDPGSGVPSFQNLQCPTLVLCKSRSGDLEPSGDSRDDSLQTVLASVKFPRRVAGLAASIWSCVLRGPFKACSSASSCVATGPSGQVKSNYL
jgi:hypothetical protein